MKKEGGDAEGDVRGWSTPGATAKDPVAKSRGPRCQAASTLLSPPALPPSLSQGAASVTTPASTIVR